MKIKVLIADDIKETRDIIKKILLLEDEFEIVGEACDGEETLRLIPKLKPDVVLMDINMPVLNGLEATERITKLYPNVIVIIMSVQGESEYLKKAMFYGAKEYIIKPFNYESLIETIKVTYERYKDILSKLNVEEEIRDGKIVTFFSSKGGVGKTVLAVNSAVEFSKTKKTILIDMDLMFGDVSLMVDGANHKTILDTIDDEQLDSYNSLKPYIFGYKENLDILFAPKKPESAEYIGKDSVEKIFKIIKRHYDLIIVDTGINFNDTTLYVLDNSDYILLISTMDIISLKNTKLGLSVMKSLGYDNKKVKIVINRFNTDYGINKGDVEDVFKENIFASIPDDEKTVLPSINNGKPFMDNNKLIKSKLAKAIETLCKTLEV
ncbi:Transcriptional regulatory protein DegU [Caloramator mitchellensis]|uniref:Stage 0 sporulation protein A homolog n=1 Tax=Caloramator mitchellensis TaxID=908809 RepID=A0A0R3JRY2_CALMK|nr:response regulator [Caloramator mitchellensis]KRQ86263.1 Transcriptional regulatory protein DegU [Caloramator mitchellensis]